MNLKGFGVIRAVRTADSTDLWVAGSKCVNAKRQLHLTDHGVSVKVVARTSDRKRSGGLDDVRVQISGRNVTCTRW